MDMIYKIENLTFTYPNHDKPALDDVNLVIGRGEFVTICGPSGCGKTTLLRHMKPSATPHGIIGRVKPECGIKHVGRANEDAGSREGGAAIYFCGVPTGELSARDAAAKIGFVTQSPDNQMVTDKVWHELAFGLESLGVKTPEIRLRVAEMASFFGIQTWFRKPITELSGGQKQILALASIMATQPSALLLDEPTSQLDPIAAGEFLAMVAKINQELDVTVILTEHRLEEALPLSTRAVVMDKGRIIADGSPREAGLWLCEHGGGMFLAMPTAMRVWAACEVQMENGQWGIEHADVPITVRDGANWLASLSKSKMGEGEWRIAERINSDGDEPQFPILKPEFSAKVAIEMKDVWFRYEKNQPDVIKDLSFKARYGEFVTILGGNGTGKTTALTLIAGINKPLRGNVTTDTVVYALPQNPQSLFVAKTVREDLLEMLSEQKLPKDAMSQRLAAMVRLCRLEDVLDSHPYDLSGGEQQRAALAKLLLLQPRILLFDEPTKGLDAEFKQTFAAIIRKLTETGAAVVMVSHDVEFCAEHADRCALFFDGGIVTENYPRAFFAGNSFYTTSANRMARDVLPGAITANDIIIAIGGEVPPMPEMIDINAKYEIGEEEDLPPVLKKGRIPFAPAVANSQRSSRDARLSKRTLVAAVMILLAIPITIYVGSYFFGDRRYYFISLLIVLETMLPFALVFERRKPQARELVIIAVMCAIAVVGRAAFFMLPQFKPVVAIIIIGGVAFGGEAGFLIGAMTGFVSNFFIGQGPWTPYQMFALGVIGFLSGALFKKGVLRRAPVSLAVFGAFATVIIYGGIMNPASVLIWQPGEADITGTMVLASYIQGIPFDLIQAAATVAFMLIIARPMLEKLDRIKEKYGLY
ncbi:MAG: ATP-binding cassette domain-containing protein [Oscillospiraceae bacterium]|nr:ATP-binding cassette domain-containing protein [Oscillospiraceae bacterium]